MKKEKEIQVKVRKPVAKKPTSVILSKKDKLERKRVKPRDLMKNLYNQTEQLS
jgi:hypothetical protein